MNAAVVVLNPRRIEECVSSIEALSVDKVWLQGMWETQLAEAQQKVPEYDFYIITADDCVVSQKALDAVLQGLEEHPVVTGYCRLDSKSPYVNLSSKPIIDPMPRMSSYRFLRYIDVATSPEPLISTGFVGMAMTGMTKEIWDRFPLTVSPIGAQTDFSLSYRLTEAGIPMYAHRDAHVDHVKETWNFPDMEYRKRLLIGEIPAGVRIQRQEVAC